MSRRIYLPFAVAVCILVTGMTLVGASRLLADMHASGNIPELMSYQGYATDSGGGALDGSYDMVFKIYDSSSAGTKYWEESHTDVAVNSGYFTVMLGSNGTSLTPSVFAGAIRYMEVTIGTDGPLPRQQFGAVPYALQAHTAHKAVEATYAMTATVALNASEGASYENVIVVAKSGGDYTSVADALSSITSTSFSSRYLVFVAPGVYTETSLVDVPAYVHLRGAGPNVSVISSTRSDPSVGSAAATAEVQENGRMSDLTIYNDATANTAVAVYMGSGVSRSTVMDNVVAKARGAGGSSHYAVYLKDAEPTIKRSWLSATGATGTTANVGLGSENVANGFPQALIEESTILGGVDNDKSCSIQTGVGMKLTESAPHVDQSYICGGRRAIQHLSNGFPVIRHSTVLVSSANGAYLVETTASGIVSFAASRLQYFTSGSTGLATGAGSAPRCVVSYDFGTFDELDSDCVPLP